MFAYAGGEGGGSFDFEFMFVNWFNECSWNMTKSLRLLCYKKFQFWYKNDQFRP